jgi:hypothetical protein
MTEKKKKPPIWAYADEWDGFTDMQKAIKLAYLAGIQAGVEGRVPTKGYPLPPQVGDVIQYDSAWWQWGQVEAIDGDQMFIWRMGPSDEESVFPRPIANAVRVVSRRGVERRRTA